MAKIGRTKKKVAAKTRRMVPAPGADGETNTPSPTAVAAEAMATGIVPGDPDGRSENTSFLGDVTPAGDMRAPGQDQVDPYGRAMGVAEEDSGALRTSSELLDRRDKHRAFQEVPEDHTKE